MKVWFFGSTQTKHIEKVFSNCGYEIVNSNNKCKGFFSKFETVFKLLSCDIIYCVSGIDINESAFFRLAVFLRKKIIVHWIGTDVLTFTQKYNESKKVINKNCINLSVSSQLQRELEEIKIKTEVVPIFPPNYSCEALGIPEKHRVLSYIPEVREAFYGMELVKNVAQQFSNIEFHIVANTGKNDMQKLPNIYYHGMLNSEELKKMYEQCTVLFRFPEHDGLPVMVLEALGYGRMVIYRYEHPYVYTPKSDNLEDILETFKQVFESPYKLNVEAIEFVKNEFSMEKQIQWYKQVGIID